MDEALQVGQQPRHLVWWRRHERGPARPRTADPVLRAPQLARLLAGAACAIEQQAVGVAQQAHRDRQAGLAAQVVAHEAEGAQVVGDLLDIGRVGQHLASLVIEQVGQRGLGALDLRGEQRLLADGAVEQPVDRRHQAGHAGQPGQGHLGAAVGDRVALSRQRRVGRRQRIGHERLHRLAQRGGGDVVAGGAHRMKAGLSSRPS
jgi:hypothetical protein